MLKNRQDFDRQTTVLHSSRTMKKNESVLETEISIMILVSVHCSSFIENGGFIEIRNL